MSKIVRFLKESQREFQRVFKGLCNAHSSWEVWGDFVRMSAIAISNACDQKGETHDRREERYQQIIKRYTEQEKQAFPNLLAIVVNSLEADPDQDFLGELFMALELSNHWKGQFFTPYCICKCMAEMQIEKCTEQLKKKSYISTGLHRLCLWLRTSTKSRA